MPKGHNVGSAKGKGTAARRRIFTSEASTSGVGMVREPEATPSKKKGTFKNLMAKYHGVKLTPLKLGDLMNASGSEDEEARELEREREEESSTTDSEKEEEPVRPRRKVARLEKESYVETTSEISDISVPETASEYAPSEIEGDRDFSGFEILSDDDLHETLQERSEDSSASSAESEIAPTRRPRRTISFRRRSQGRRVRARLSRGARGRRMVDPMQQEDDEVAQGWSLDNTPPPGIPFTGTPGMTCPIPTTPLGFFQLLVPFKLLFFFMEETNDYASYLRHELKRPSKYNWSGCNVIDIAKYLGIILWMGIIKLPEMKMYWSRRKTFSLSAFPAAMPRSRFEVLSKYFHTFNRRAIPKDNRDKLIVVRPVLDYIKERCKSLYLPMENLSIDEGMLKWKGRLSIKCYNPMKPVKYGIKFFFLCESESGYVLDFMVYRGVYTSLRDIVFGLMGTHLNKGHHLFMDNYYNHVSISDELYDNGTHCSGTLRLGRGGPESLKNLKKVGGLTSGQMAYRRKNNTFVICWQDRRLVTMISNKYNADTELYVHRRRDPAAQVPPEQQLQRPVVIRDYVNYMGGVDLFDQLVNYYSFAKRSLRWTKKTIFYMLQIALLNAYILYAKYGPLRAGRNRKMTLREFHQEIADALLYFDENEWPDDRSRIPRAASLPVDERQDILPTPSPQDSPSVDDPDAPAASPDAPAASPEVPADVPARPLPPVMHTAGQVYQDPADRLDATLDHREEQIPSGPRKYLQKRCRVCYSMGKRMDTRFWCSHCKIPLCIFRRDCFRRYHTVSRYWIPTPARGASGTREGAIPPQ